VSRRNKYRRLWEILNLLALLVIIAVAPLHVWPRVALLLILAISWSLYYLAFMREKQQPLEETSSTAESELLSTRIRDLIDAALVTSQGNAQARSYFAYMMLYPQATRRRIKETIDLSEDLLTKHANAEIGLESIVSPEYKAEYLYVPVLRPLKKRLFTGFTVRDAQDTAVSTLSYEESLVFITALLRDLYADAFGLSHDTRAWDDQHGAMLSAAVEILLTVPDYNELSAKERREFRNRMWNVFDERAKPRLPQGEISKERYLRLKNVIEILSSNYVIIGLMPWQKRFSVAYSYRVPKDPFTHTPKGKWLESVKGELRRTLGGEPASIEIAANKAKRCASYHLVLQAPEGSYVVGATLVDEDGKRMSRQRRMTHELGRAYFRIVGRGQREAHFYSRRLAKVESQLSLRILVRETPPGAVGRATFVALLTSAMIVASGHLIVTSSGHLGGGDVSALIVGGIPAALGSFSFVLGWGSRRSSVVSLASVLSALVTMVVATTGICFALAWPVGWAQNGPGWLDVFGIDDWLWAALFLVSVGNLAAISAALSIRLVRHNFALKKSIFSIDAEAVTM
jgi:hypothetical protein